MDEARSNVKVDNKDGGGGGMRRVVGSYDMLLRIMCFCFTLVAVLVAGFNEQTRVISIGLVDGATPLRFAATAKWHYLSAIVFFVVSNAIACTYSAGSLMLSLIHRNKKKNQTQLALLIADLIMVSLLFSANGAASAVGILGLKGNSHVQWQKVCYVFKKFCNQGAASVAVSFLGSFAFLLLVILATLNLHKRSRLSASN